jgi:predicted ribosomally synthesized peptide with SipW-like signal peptide
MRRRSLLLFGAVAALVLGLSGGAAFAYFTSSGSGSGTANAGTVSSVTVEAATGLVSNQLQPGTSGDLLITINNPNSTALKLVSVSQNGSVTVAGGSSCTGATSGVTIPTQSGLTLTIPTGTATVVVPDGAAMSTSSASGCQGASFQVPVSISVEQG